MFRQAKPLLMILSVALNVAFVGVWLAYAAAPRQWWLEKPCEPAEQATIWCPLHRELQCTPEQWHAIEPRLRAFRGAADAVGREIHQGRLAVIDLLASVQPDVSAIEARQEEILERRRAMQALVCDQLLYEKSVLSAQQQEQLFETLRSHAARARGGPLLVPGGGHEGGLGQVLRTGGSH